MKGLVTWLADVNNDGFPWMAAWAAIGFAALVFLFFLLVLGIYTAAHYGTVAGFGFVFAALGAFVWGCYTVSVPK